MKNKISEQRAILGITQAELAEEVGLSESEINDIEENRYIVSGVDAIKIAMFFGKPVEEIFFPEKEDFINDKSEYTPSPEQAN